MQAIFIPNALYMAFRNEGRTTQDFVNLDSLANTLSPEDVAFYMAANRFAEACVPEPVAQSFEFINFTQQFNQIENAETRTAIEIKLNGMSVKDIGALLTDDKTKMLTSDILDGNVILFTYIDCPPGSAQLPGPLDFYDRLVNQVTALTSFQHAVKLPIMAAYMQAQQDVIFE